MSTQDRIAVSLSGLEGQALELEGILKLLNENLETLYTRVERVVLNWQGEARETFIDELDKWDAHARDLEASQKWLHEVVLAGHGNFKNAHKAVVRGWGGA